VIGKILDRYLLKELIPPFVFGIAAFTCILMGGTVVFQLVGRAIQYGIPFSTVLQILLYKVPSVVAFTFPMSMLLATILAFGRLSNDLEVLAFRAGGIGVYRLVRPVIAMGLVVSLFTIAFNNYVVPQAAYSAERSVQQFKDKKNPQLSRQVNFTQYNPDGSPMRTFSIKNATAETLDGVTMIEYGQGQVNRVTLAKTGKWVASGGWELENGMVHQLEKDQPDQITLIEFKTHYIDIPLSKDRFTEEKLEASEITIQSLKSRIARQIALGEDPIENIVHYHLKFSIPFASLIFAILGSAVGLRPHHRSSSALGLGISLVVILIYYILLSLGMGLGITHIIPPVIGAWLPNIVVGSCALLLFKRIGE
jgi:lipopolysaccharide export system permease protein